MAAMSSLNFLDPRNPPSPTTQNVFPIPPELELRDEETKGRPEMPSTENPDGQTQWEAWPAQEPEETQEERRKRYQKGYRDANRLGKERLLAFKEEWKRATREQQAPDVAQSIDNPDEQTRWEKWEARERARKREWNEANKERRRIYQKGCRDAEHLGAASLEAYKEEWKRATREQKALAVAQSMSKQQNQECYLRVRDYQVEYQRAKRKGVGDLKALRERKKIERQGAIDPLQRDPQTQQQETLPPFSAID